MENTVGVVSRAEYQRMVEGFQEQLNNLRSEKLVMAMLLVKAAGGKIVVPSMAYTTLDNRSYIQEDHNPENGDITFTTWEKPIDCAIH